MRNIVFSAIVIVLVCAVLGVGQWTQAVGQTATTQPAAMEASTDAGRVVELPKPQTTGGMGLMDALRLRQSQRRYSPRPLDDQMLSNLLWAAWGINREDGKRTAPSARNWQEVDVYVAKADGLWLFEAEGHRLRLISPRDIRELTGSQGFVKDAPVNLVFVADLAKMGSRAPEAMREFYAATDTGFISQNVYLFCASEKLATVVRGLVDRDALSPAMGLRADQRIILAQSVGYPAE